MAPAQPMPDPSGPGRCAERSEVLHRINQHPRQAKAVKRQGCTVTCSLYLQRTAEAVYVSQVAREPL